MIDVIVPCYNYGRYLAGCVRSVLDQQGVDVRVLIIDDTSTDETPEVGRQLAADQRVEFRHHNVNQGHIATYNEGLDWVTGDYALVLSADDLLTPGSLERAVRLMNEHPEVGFVYGKRILWQEETIPTNFVERPYTATVIDGATFLEQMCRTVDNPVCTPTAVVRSSVQRAVGQYRKELPHTGDFEMWMRFAVHGAVGVLDSDQAYWRFHGQNMRERYRGTATLEQHRVAFNAVFREHDIVDAKRLRSLAEYKLAENAVWAASKCFEQGRENLCRVYLAYAVRLVPTICSSRAWKRLRWKQLFGRRVWSFLSTFRQTDRKMSEWQS